MEDYEHIPVLLDEVIGLLHPKPGQNFIDATLGGGGYSRAILERVGSLGRVLSIDLDGAAVEHTQSLKLPSENWIIVRGNFSHLDRIVKNHNFPPPDGIVADLGLSSHELETAGRGMSFQKDELLDMRFDLSQTKDAKFVLNNYSKEKLAEIFKEYGEERFGYQIAKNIERTKIQSGEIRRSSELYEIIRSSVPKQVRHKAADSARRIFQALRIEVNGELENLSVFLPKALDLLAPGGIMAVVSFHSLEDRIVKTFFAHSSRGCVCPPDFPQCICGKNPKARLLTKKGITASEAEISVNGKARSARLRAIIKT